MRRADPPKLEFKIVPMRFCQSRARLGPAALFLDSFRSTFFCSLPRQLSFRAGIAILARKVTMEGLAILEIISALARFTLSARFAGRVLGHGRLFQFPWVGGQRYRSASPQPPCCNLAFRCAVNNTSFFIYLLHCTNMRLTLHWIRIPAALHSRRLTAPRNACYQPAATNAPLRAGVE